MFSKITDSYLPESSCLHLGLVWELTQLNLYSGKALNEAWEWLETEDNVRALEYGIPSIFD